MALTIATLTEIKDNENRVGLTPEGVQALREHGHSVLVQSGAGTGAGFSDALYKEAGASVHEHPSELVSLTDILVKVKEPLPQEYDLLGLMAGKTLFTYLHLSGVDPELTRCLLQHHITAIAYETVEDDQGLLPLLIPMSAVAGILSVQYGAEFLQKKYNGRGVSMGSVPGADPTHVLVVGAGIVGRYAARSALKMGSHVTLLDINERALERAEQEFADLFTEEEWSRIDLRLSTPSLLSDLLLSTDLLIGAVLVAGAKAPLIVTEAQVRSMRPGAVIIDVAIDQGGCIFGSHATSHSEPTYELHGVIYCCIPNMPGQIPRQSTQALTTATLPYLLRLADDGFSALANDPGFAKGLNTHDGHITLRSVAEDLGMTAAFSPFTHAPAQH